MRLTKLTIYGFKSFAKRTEIVLPQNITAIVGPNGSGKSNIADAVRWVLGEQSAKTLRGNSMQDVIFNGTTQRRAMNFCEVGLTFDNSDGQLPIEYQEVTILRRVYRSGDSEYLLNGTTCRLRDIVDLMRDTGVGREGYSIIGQGRIDEILSQRSEDRRAVFEEAAGISRFRSRKEEAEGRLKKAEENLLLVDNLLDQLTAILAPLKEEADTAREYLRLSAQLKELDLRLYFIRKERTEKKEIEAEQLVLQLTDSVQAVQNALEADSAERERMDGIVSGLQERLSDAHAALLERKELFFAAKELVTDLQNKLQAGKEEQERLNIEENSLKARLKLMEATLNQSEDGMAKASDYMRQAREELDKRRNRLDSSTRNVEQLEEELSRHNARVMNRLSRIQDAKTSQARQLAMQQAMQTRRVEIEAQLTEGEKAGQELKQKYQIAKESLQSEEKLLADCQRKAEETQNASETLLSGILQKQKEIHELQQSYRETAARLRTLKELQEGMEGYQYSVRNALNHAKKTGMNGVRGVIAMLLRVPGQYETALDMALGAAMQNIVTDTEQEAKQLIDYLRSNHLGRATFLPISTVKGRTLTAQERQVLTMDGCLGVASELISFEEKYRGIVESLLGRTVVARDLDCAIPIMKKANHAFRLVTLNGDVMHPGGSMTGGSIQQKAQNLLGREREISELSQKTRQMEKTGQEVQQELTRMEEGRQQSRDKAAQAAEALRQQDIAVARDTEHLSAAKAEMESHESRLDALRDAIRQIDESLEGISEELKRIEGLAKTAETDDEDLSAKTELLSERLDNARREKEKLQETVTDAMLLVQGAEHDADVLRRDTSRLREDRLSCNQQLMTIEERRSNALLHEQENIKALHEAEASIGQKEQAIQAAEKNVEETDASLKAAGEELRDIQSRLETGNTMLLRESEKQHRAEAQLERTRAEKEQLAQRLWHSYELTHAGAEETLAAIDVHRTDNWRDDFNEKAAEDTASAYRQSIRSMGDINTGSIEEYTKMAERHTELTTQKEDLNKAKADLQELIEDLLKQMETVFVSQFSDLQTYFAECFTRLFGGGYGEISLSDPKNPLDCGIEIIVQPPGKKRQILSLFSGGERALTAIAILFAMLRLKPTPFCILDEIEAALDDANIATYADFLKEFSEGTQFIVITHRKGTMERCDTLFGVAMQEKGVSSMVSVNLTDYEEEKAES